MSGKSETTTNRFVNGRWIVGGRIDRLDGLAWRQWVKFHARYRCFVTLAKGQRWRMKHAR